MLLTADPAIDIAESLRTLRDGRYQCVTEGVTTWKLAEDLDRYHEVIDQTRPDVIVETGTRYGGSALWFAGLGVNVITIDIKDSTPAGYDAIRRTERGDEPITRIVDLNGSADPRVAERVAEMVKGMRVMVSLDSDHHAPHVEAEIRRYAPLVTPGCYLVVEDGIFDLAENPRDARNGGHQIPELGGPFRAIEATVAGWADWERDRVVEAMSPLTHHPCGWWRKL
jgi:cephalosporin hydroxylase